MSAVLIVEDEKHLADGLRFNLKAEGYEVDVAGSAEEAYPLLTDRQPPYDVIVLDVMLPGMDGFSLASRLRSQGHFVPILMLTARGQAEDVLRGFESGADDYSPSDMPIEGPTRYELGLNRKAAAAIGLTLPASLTRRADRTVG